VRSRRFALVLLLLAVTFSTPCFSQNPPPIRPAPGQLPGQTPSPEDEERQRLEKEMAKKANHERQVHLKRDTDRLFKLATDLKDYVDKSNENTLSVSVINKAEEIEKLARSVKEKMKGN
jgi:hypothetical protein